MLACVICNCSDLVWVGGRVGGWWVGACAWMPVCVRVPLCVCVCVCKCVCKCVEDVFWFFAFKRLGVWRNRLLLLLLSSTHIGRQGFCSPGSYLVGEGVSVLKMKPNKQTNIHQRTEYSNLFCTNIEQFRYVDNYMFLTYPFTKEGEESSAGDLVPTFLDSYTQWLSPLSST